MEEATVSGVHRSNHHHSSSRSSNGRQSIESYKSIRNKHRDQYAEEEEEGEDADSRLSEDAVTSMSLLGGSTSNRNRTTGGPSRSSRWKFSKDDFYTRIIDEWRKTRRKKQNWKTIGRFIFTLLREFIFARWTVQIQIIFLVTIFIVTLIFTIHIYHHSHFSPHPWRQHCATQPPFPISRYVQEEPVGLFVGVMSMASEKAAIQRQAIRESWAGHWASRGRWDEGQIWNPSEMNETSLPDNIRNPTSRVVVRFIMGWPTPEFRAAIREEMQEYNDIVIVPMRENMNDGKTFAFFDWSFKHALVPPTSSNLSETAASLDSFTSSTRGEEQVRDPHWNTDDGKERPNGWAMFRHSERRPPAPHDPLGPDGKPFKNKEDWVRPDYVVKTDDDSFIMLAELEARLRVLPKKGVYWGYPVYTSKANFHAGEAYALSWDLVGHVSTYARRNRPRTMPALSTSTTTPHVLTVSTGETEKRTREGGSDQPVRHYYQNGNAGSPPRRHGQRYRDLALKISGREDQVTAGWMKDHAEEWGVTWYDDRCWIYDHAKAGTVYSKGFLFPKEVDRVRDEWNPGLRPGLLAEARETGQAHSRPEYKRLHDPTYSTVHRPFYRFSYPFAPKWDTLYRSPLPSVNYSQLDEHALNMRTEMEQLALIEGSELSMLVSGSSDDGEIGRRWARDITTGWTGRYMLDVPLEGSTGAKRLRVPIGGTVVVHFVKRPEYWQECVDILLEGWAHERALKDARQYLI